MSAQGDIDTDKEEKPEPHVTIQAKVIAAGVDGNKLKVALQLSPAPATEARPGFPLARWPSEVRNVIHGTDPKNADRIMVKFTRADVGNDPRRFDFVGAASASALKAVLPAKNGTDLNIIQELWRHTFSRYDGAPVPTKEDPLVWRILLALLNRSRNGASWEANMDNTDANRADATVTTVLDSRYRVMAPLAEILRAREILETLRRTTEGEGTEDEEDSRLLSENRIMRALKLKWDIHTNPVLPSEVPSNEKPDDTRKRVLEEAREIELSYLRSSYSDRATKEARDEFAEAKKELEGARRDVSSPNVGLNFQAIKTGSIVRLNEELTHSVASYAYTSWHNTPPSSTPAQTKNTDDGAAAGMTPGEDVALLQDKRAPELAQRFFNLQSTPALSRLFMLVVDCEIELSEVPSNGLYYLCLADTTGPKFDATVVQTLAGFSGPDRQNSFWPALRRELHEIGVYSSDASCLIDQRHGLIALGSQYADGSRFELTSLDVRSLAERLNETNRRRVAAVKPRKYASGPVPRTPRDRTETVDPEQEAVAQLTSRRDTLPTAGLTILDGDRANATARRLAGREYQNKRKDAKEIILDADDLLQGYKIDIGAGRRPGAEADKSDKYATAWQTLMNRKLDFGAAEAGPNEDGKRNARVREILKGLIGALGDKERYEIDGALISTDLKFAEQPVPGESTKTEGEPPKGDILGIADQVILSWTGEPLGVDCAVPSSAKESAPDNLPFGRTVDLPSDHEEDFCSPNLRLGRLLRVGMRAVYQGGVGPSLDAAKIHYDAPVAGNQALSLVLPSAHAATSAEDVDLPFRRFLRHERLLPPYLLLPASTVLSSHGRMGFESAAHAIVRSFVDENGKLLEGHERATPSVVVRYVLPPVVPQSLAVLHGAYDGLNAAKIPHDVEGVLINPVTGGFPAAEAAEGRGLNSEVYLSGRAPTYCPKSTAETFFATMASLPKQYIGKDDLPPPGEEVGYHVDPLADYYIVAARFAGTQVYLKGPPLLVPAVVKVGQVNFRNVAPLKITIERRELKGEEKTSNLMRDVLSMSGLPIDIQEVFGKNVGKPTKGRSVAVKLLRGDDLEIDVWCIPCKESIRRTMAAAESIAALALAGNPKKDGKSWARFVEGFKTLVGEEDAKGPLAEAEKARVGDLSYLGPAGLAIASERAVDAVAGYLFNKLQHRPIDEISSVRTFRATHAVNRPVLAPTLDTPDKDRALAIARPSRQKFEELAVSPADSRFKTYFGLETKGVKGPLADPDAHDFAIGGAVQIDLDSSDGFEIHAKTVSPRSPLFDDPARGRSAIDRRSGFWPEHFAYDEKKDGFAKSYVPPNTLFGFDVFADGVTRLPTTWVKLFRVTNLKSARQMRTDPTANQLERIDVETLYGIAAGKRYKHFYDEIEGGPIDSKLLGAQVRLEHAFPDGKARKLELRIDSISRFSSLMSTAPVQDKAGNFLRPEPLRDEDDSSSSAANIFVWLPATVRPASPQTRSPVPVFSWQATGPLLDKSTGRLHYDINRKVLVRIPLKRGWFSSGEDERLGIVLWPPKILDPRNDFDKDVVWVPGNGDEDFREAKLPDFVDSDLGAAGAYITRWGGDPIRGSTGGQTGNFLSPAQFGGIGDDLAAGGAQIVDDVIMPVTVSEKGVKRVETLRVSLVTYQPRFDLDKEEWYVDVELHQADAPDPFVRFGLVRYQAHAAADLQVSEPIVEWTQLMPSRTMSAVVDRAKSSDSSGKADTKFTICVTVNGPASTDISTGHKEPTDEDRKNRHPRVKITAFLEERVGTTSHRKLLQRVIVDNLDPKQRRTADRRLGCAPWTRFGEVRSSAPTASRDG